MVEFLENSVCLKTVQTFLCHVGYRTYLLRRDCVVGSLGPALVVCDLKIAVEFLSLSLGVATALPWNKCFLPTACTRNLMFIYWNFLVSLRCRCPSQTFVKKTKILGHQTSSRGHTVGKCESNPGLDQGWPSARSLFSVPDSF